MTSHAAKAFLLAAILTAVLGCSITERNGDGGLGRDRDGSRSTKACARGKGLVKVRTWERRVEEFQNRQYPSKKRFQRRKRSLLRDLARVRSDACAWELQTVDELMAQVRSTTY